uniref:Uncharacterized protein n=1 Tax=Rhizophora mucronata TaxID=61149 RepID=A0A2P2QF11_RHIMU
MRSTPHSLLVSVHIYTNYLMNKNIEAIVSSPIRAYLKVYFIKGERKIKVTNG